ncbi:hypothetical protein ABT099_23800 [Streptomyces prasinus]|uniref:hypothetical protein n=1 Tax=Streptomyces prasinus TaxID=67345 RepID=UPI00332F187A
MNAETFNALHPVGTPVFAYPGCRPEDDRNATRLVTRTRSKASVFGDAPVVMLDGYERISLSHVDVISEEQFTEARAAEAAAPVGEQLPTGGMTDRLTPQREAEIAERTPGRAAALTAWLNQFSPVGGQRALENAETVLEEDVPALLAELAAVRAERDQAQAELTKYVGKEPTVAEEMAYLNRCLNAVYDLCDEAKRQATRWENPLPVPEWVAAVEKAADGQRADDPNDRRHRVFVDGKGNGWISVCHDEGTEWVVPVQPEAAVEQDVRDVADETGSLREIGRCW